MGISILAALILAGCAEVTPAPISSDRTVASVPCETDEKGETCYRVSQVWMQERYQLERALRLRLERCEVELHGYKVPTTEGAEKRTMIPWPLLVPFRQPALDHLVHP